MRDVRRAAVLVLLFTSSACSNCPAEVVWDINSVESIGGHKAAVMGSPRVINTEKGKAVWFDGIDDALIVDSLPAAGAEKFTLEVIIRPDPNGYEAEQKFLHMQQNDSRNRIILLLGAAAKQRWYFDTFVKTETGTRNMWDASKTHPCGRWYNVAIVCDGKRVGQYVNGVLELEGDLVLTALGEGKTSIGAKSSGDNCCKGAIRKIRLTPRALKPREFLKP